MRPDSDSPTGPAKRPHSRHERHGWPPDLRRGKNPPRSWTNKSMHHPATRIGEIKHGKT